VMMTSKGLSHMLIEVVQVREHVLNVNSS
jgi:hypothetical protein